MSTQIKERPILFSGAMVRALLDGSKTQTRRIVKDDPGPYWMPRVGLYNPVVIANGGYEAPGPEIYGASDEHHGRKCPYGQPGHRLWVRETWGVVSNAWGEDGNLVDWVPDRPATAVHEMRFGGGYYSGHAIYAADGGYEWAGDDDGGGEPRSAWHPSIHMPRAASRILLEVVSVRVERLNACSQSDAISEGAVSIRSKEWDREHFPVWRYLFDEAVAAGEKPPVGPSPVQAYQALWESINGVGSWDADPWVWVVEFKRAMP
ncbi:hypothetical protein [Massilia timonae]|uniref:Phage-related protein n=1 Tax=Massilia timonae TaxID=47229 RepID=A0A1S2N313_9BURK|nr:hypothetical protein [Massilia timonae]OIJ39478.1 hypothetical protein LO55_5048 [Massilia timonae]